MRVVDGNIEYADWIKNEIGVLLGLEYKFNHYFTGLSNGSSKEYLMLPASGMNTGIRAITIKAEAECEIRLFRNPTLTSNGSDISSYIHNTNELSSNVSGATMYEDPVYTNEGTLISIDYAPGNGSYTYEAGEVGGMMLMNPSYTYMYQILNVSGGTMSRASIVITYREW